MFEKVTTGDVRKPDLSGFRTITFNVLYEKDQLTTENLTPRRRVLDKSGFQMFRFWTPIVVWISDSQ